MLSCLCSKTIQKNKKIVLSFIPHFFPFELNKYINKK